MSVPDVNLWIVIACIGYGVAVLEIFGKDLLDAFRKDKLFRDKFQDHKIPRIIVPTSERNQRYSKLFLVNTSNKEEAQNSHP